MNRWDIEEAAERYAGHPVLGPATESLHNLMEWTDCHSDGWPYWAKPSRAASKLIEMIKAAERAEYRYDRDYREPTAADLQAAYRPIKAFRTRQGADFLLAEEAAAARDAERVEAERAAMLGIPTKGR